MKLLPLRFRLNIRRRFFIEMVFGHWNRIPREMTMASSLLELEMPLDKI